MVAESASSKAGLAISELSYYTGLLERLDLETFDLVRSLDCEMAALVSAPGTSGQALLVDMRSDTVTRPTHAMRQAMAEAVVGDDVMRDDPTVKALEERIAALFKKEASIFFPTGTMSNLTAALCWCPGRGSEMIVGDNSHMFLFEQAGAAQFGGISPRTVVNNPDGTMDLEAVRLAIRDDDVHEPATKLICVEDTHNACGGRVLPVSFLRDLKALAAEHSLPVHMDGARIWNACTAMNCPPHELGAWVDSISVCLSKGLGAPAGSLLVGSHDLIAKARRIRKALGGGMRQVGILAAAGLKGLDDFEAGMLTHDHRRAKQLASGLRGLVSFEVDEAKVDTNIIFVNLLRQDSSKVQALLKERNVLVSAWAPKLIRLAVHRDIDDEQIAVAIEALRQVSATIA